MTETRRPPRLAVDELASFRRVGDVVQFEAGDGTIIEIPPDRHTEWSERARHVPVRLGSRDEPGPIRTYWWLRGIVLVEDERLDVAQVNAELLRLVDGEGPEAWTQALKLLPRATFPAAGGPDPMILRSVHAEVWTRDRGACTHCGIREGLTYEYVVPLDRGGKPTAPNMRLACRYCRGPHRLLG